MSGLFGSTIWEDPSVAANTSMPVYGGMGGGFGYGGYMPFSLSGDPGFRRQAAYEALTNAGLGLIQASAPSRTPTDLGTAFGSLMGGAATGVASARDHYLKQQLMMGQLQNMRIQQQAMAQLPYILGNGQGSQPTQGDPNAAPPTGGGDYNTTLATNEGGVGGYTTPNALGSGAYGKYQFMPQTWADIASAHPELKLPFNMRQSTPEQQEAAQAAFTADNAKALRAAGVQPTPANLALAHWVGADGAKKVLAADPNTPIGDILGKAVLEKNPGLNTTAGALVGGLNKKYAGVQLAQAPGGDSGFPEPPPRMTRAQEIGLANPVARPIVQAQIAEQQKQYEARKAKWEANQKLLATRREEEKLGLEKETAQRAAEKLKLEKEAAARTAANADLVQDENGNWVPNKGKLAAEAEKKRVETEATEKARENFLFGGPLNRSPEELRKTVNPQLLSLVDSIQSGRTKLSSINTERVANGISFGKAEVLALGEKLYGDKFDPNKGDIAYQFEQNMKDSNHPSGKLAQSINTVYQHLDQWQDLYLKIGNSDAPGWNAVRRWLHEQTGKSDYTTAEALSHAVGTEIANVIKGQQLNMPEVEAAVNELNTARSPEQAMRAIGALRHAMQARENNLKEQAADAYLPQEKVDRIIKPSARKAIDNFDRVQADFEKQQAEKKAVPPPNRPPLNSFVRP